MHGHKESYTKFHLKVVFSELDSNQRPHEYYSDAPTTELFLFVFMFTF